MTTEEVVFLKGNFLNFKFMVPKAGFEPARVSPHAPQTCVSTRFHHFGSVNITIKIEGFSNFPNTPLS